MYTKSSTNQNVDRVEPTRSMSERNLCTELYGIKAQSTCWFVGILISISFFDVIFKDSDTWFLNKFPLGLDRN